MKQQIDKHLPKCSEDRLVDRAMISQCLALLTQAESHRMRGLLNRYLLSGSIVEGSGDVKNHIWYESVIEMRKTIRAYVACRKMEF